MVSSKVLYSFLSILPSVLADVYDIYEELEGGYDALRTYYHDSGAEAQDIQFLAWTVEISTGLFDMFDLADDVEKARHEDSLSKYFAAEQKWVLEMLNGAVTRTVSTYCPNGQCNVPLSLRGIWGYGCWCNFGNNLMEGHGPVQNEFDGICKDFQLCLRCARRDGKIGGYGCNPITKSYEASKYVGFGIVDCTASNQNDLCAQHTCSCEQTLLAELIETIWAQILYTDTYKHEINGSPNWDQESNCPVPEPNPNDIDCCGYYPKRFPYSNTGLRECCDDQTLYNPFTHDCCNMGDGSTDTMGMCGL